MQWFEREFQFPFPTDIYPCLVERLGGLIPRVRERATRGGNWTARVDGKWSAQENLGHLADLEDLWQGRLDDFAAGAKVLRPADLENTATHAANHNAHQLSAVVDRLVLAREATVRKLAGLKPDDFAAVGRHPRLDKEMRLVDLLFFIAEHDDHHLARVAELLD